MRGLFELLQFFASSDTGTGQQIAASIDGRLSRSGQFRWRMRRLSACSREIQLEFSHSGLVQ